MIFIVAVLPVTRLIELLGIRKVAIDRYDPAIRVRDVAVQPVGHRPVEEILEPNGGNYRRTMKRQICPTMPSGKERYM